MFDQEVKRKGKRTRNNEAFAMINATEPGKSMILFKHEWKLKTLPGMNIIRRRLKREFKVETLRDNTGWKISSIT